MKNNNVMWFFTIITIIAAFLNVFKNPICFILWIIADIGFFIRNYVLKDYAQATLWLVYLILSIFGLIAWL